MGSREAGTAGGICPICRSPTAPAGEKRGQRTGRTFALARCGQCGFAFVVEPWTDFAAIYDEAYYEGRGSDPLVDYAFEFEHPRRSTRQYEWRGIASFVRQFAPPGGKWLDFGCGTGGLVRYLRASGHGDVYGVDTGVWAKRARDSGVPVLSEAEVAAHEGTFDVVTAIEVIEHVMDPVATLRQLRSLLKRGGWLFLTTGNAAAAPARFTDWSYVVPEIHVSYFTPRALAMALQQSGFAPVLRGRGPGWNDILRFKILKTLRVREVNWLERCLPWSLLAALADAKYRVTAHPLGRAV